MRAASWCPVVFVALLLGATGGCPGGGSAVPPPDVPTVDDAPDLVPADVPTIDRIDVPSGPDVGTDISASPDAVDEADSAEATDATDVGAAVDAVAAVDVVDVPTCGTSGSCAEGTTCCGGTCVDLATSPAHCGRCDAACPVPANAVATCLAGACGSACRPGLADCNGRVDDGCEVDTRTSLAHCGACDHACPSPAAAIGTCVDGGCGITCHLGYANCDGIPDNGCEVDTVSSAAHCGGCDHACPAAPGATGVCRGGACGIACDAGRGDCNGMASDGCEVDTATAVTDCGTCGHACPAGANATRTCAGGACGLRCDATYADCDGMASNGCETRTSDDAMNCGACRSVCGAPWVCATSRCCTPLAQRCGSDAACCSGLRCLGGFCGTRRSEVPAAVRAVCSGAGPTCRWETDTTYTIVINGCTGSPDALVPLFLPCCNQHDADWSNCTMTQAEADTRFLSCMLAACPRHWAPWLCEAEAYVGFAGVQAATSLWEGSQNRSCWCMCTY